jgi:hypothetical protein
MKPKTIALVIACVASGTPMQFAQDAATTEKTQADELARKIPSSVDGQTNKWTFEVSLYGLAAGMSGNTTVKGVSSDVDVGFEKIWDNLKFGAMGTARVGYDRWALSTEVIYMDLEATKKSFTAQAQQWMVQPALEYRVCQYFVAYVGTRYNSIELDVNGPLGISRINTSGTHDWWDPIIGARVGLPLGKKLGFNVSGDIGGFGAGSDLTWQAYPYFNWQATKIASLQLGYRFLYNDYETGSGLKKFKYDILTHGPQLGFTVVF